MMIANFIKAFDLDRSDAEDDDDDTDLAGDDVNVVTRETRDEIVESLTPNAIMANHPVQGIQAANSRGKIYI